MDLTGKTYWLVGASEGLGRELAIAMAEAGARCILSARNTERLTDIASSLAHDPVVCRLDVTDGVSVEKAWADILGIDIDGVIYIAGYYDPISATNWDRDAVLQMADVNFIGALRVLGHVVPHFVERGSGHIVAIGSLSGYRGLPGAIGYGASKAGLMHLVENIQVDLKGTGVCTQMINPGFIRTRLTDKNDFGMPFIMSPKEAAQRTLRAMQSGRFKTDFPWGFSLVFRLSRLLPNWLYLRIFGR